MIKQVREFVQQITERINEQLALLPAEQAQQYLNSLPGAMFVPPYQE